MEIIDSFHTLHLVSTFRETSEKICSLCNLELADVERRPGRPRSGVGHGVPLGPRAAGPRLRHEGDRAEPVLPAGPFRTERNVEHQAVVRNRETILHPLQSDVSQTTVRSLHTGRFI